MPDSPRRLILLPRAATRTLMVLLVIVCAWTVVTVLSHGGQGGAAAPAAQVLAFPASAWQAIAHGKLDDAEALARAQGPDNPDAAAVLGHLMARRGHHKDAIAVLEPAAAKAPLSEAALELALVQQQLGRSAAAAELLTRLFREGPEDGTPESLLRAGRAARALGRAREANTLFRSASASAASPAIDTAWGLLFLEKYNAPEAVKSFTQALARDPAWAPAHAGLARTLSDDNPPAAAAAAARALEIDPTLADAELLLAQLDLDNSHHESARARIDRVLARNPSHLEARALKAAMAFVRSGRAAFDAEAREILAINPVYGEVYRAAAEQAASNYRFDDAVGLAREAVALDPTSARAQAGLGMHLMRTGEEAEARTALDRAFRIDPFDIVTYNLLQLLDTLDTFVVAREGDIILKLHPEEAAVMREYAMPLAQDALKTLSARYGFTPKGPILIEIFPRHDDFAVRNLGLPGLIGALGACFGRVITLDSPRARPPGTFSWQATLWHEMAHVITLQMSEQRVPRWLTEGISVYEEGLARPEWGRDMEVPFAVALERGKALKLKDLNAGFTRPDTIALAYFQASLLVDHIVRSYGEPKLQALVRAYAANPDGDAAVEKTLGVPLEQLQGGFDARLQQRFGPLRAALRDAGVAPAGKDITALRAAAAAQPGSYAAQMALGVALADAGEAAAFEPLERAAALVPVAIGEDSPYAVMARLAEKVGDTSRAIKAYEALLAQDHSAVEPARRLAALAEKTSAPAPLMLAYHRVVAIDPFDAQAHSALGRMALKNNDTAVAIREFKVALAIGPADKASAHCDLGEALLAADHAAEAKKEALAALEIAPTFERAQDLLLRTIKSGQERGR